MTKSNSCTHSTLAELCQEAVAHCNGDWTRIQAFLKERLSQMSGDGQKELKSEMDRILSFYAPPRRSLLH